MNNSIFSRKGQISTYIILGILILASLGVFFYFSSSAADKDPSLEYTHYQVIGNYVDSSLKTIITEGLFYSNYEELDDFIIKNISDDMDGKDFQGRKVRMGPDESYVNIVNINNKTLAVESSLSLYYILDDGNEENMMINLIHEYKLYNDLELNIYSNGMVLSSSNINAMDGMLSIDIPKGTVLKDKNNNPIKKISINIIPEESSKNSIVFQLDPDGSVFVPYIELYFDYEKLSIDGNDIILEYFNDTSKKWEFIPGGIVTQNNGYVFRAEIKHFSIYRLRLNDFDDDDKVENRDWEFLYVDDFDGAKSTDGDFGLNSNINRRQLYGPWEGTKWIRKPGHWSSNTYSPSFIQVNHIFYPNKMSFHSDIAGVMIDKQFSIEDEKYLYISAKVDPGVGSNNTAYDWISIMLDSSNNNNGYVTDTDFGFLIRDNGKIIVFQNGNIKKIIDDIRPSEEYDVKLYIIKNILIIDIDGQLRKVMLDEEIPLNSYVYLGSYLDKGNIGTIDDLIIRKDLNREERLTKYGYYWNYKTSDEPIEPYLHFDEVSSYTNIRHFDIDISTLDKADKILNEENCGNKSCYVGLRWIFTNNNPIGLRPDWESHWKAAYDLLKEKEEYVGSLYIMDEPFWYDDKNQKISPDDYRMILKKVKEDMPDIPISSIFAYPIVKDDMPYIEELDIVGFDHYPSVKEFDKIRNYQNTLNRVYPQKKLLVPQTHFEGTLTDEEVARINWLYYDLALRDENVIGLWNFGLWVFTEPSEVETTLKAQKLMGESIINE